MNILKTAFLGTAAYLGMMFAAPQVMGQTNRQQTKPDSIIHHNNGRSNLRLHAYGSWDKKGKFTGDVYGIDQQGDTVSYITQKDGPISQQDVFCDRDDYIYSEVVKQPDGTEQDYLFRFDSKQQPLSINYYQANDNGPVSMNLNMQPGTGTVNFASMSVKGKENFEKLKAMFWDNKAKPVVQSEPNSIVVSLDAILKQDAAYNENGFCGPEIASLARMNAYLIEFGIEPITLETNRFFKKETNLFPVMNIK